MRETRLLASAVNEEDGSDPSRASFAVNDGVEALVLRLLETIRDYPADVTDPRMPLLRIDG